MTSSRTNPGSGNARKKQFDSARLLLSSQRPSDIWKGIDQARQWLNEDPEDRDVYGLLLDAVDKNRDIREQVRNLLLDMMKRESQKAEEAFQLLPSSVDDLLADADDAFYAAEYERAIQLYRQVLKLDPENSRAKTHLAEARKESPVASEINPELPRDAVQYYRRARSYIAAKDFSTAMKMLGAALESAQSRGMKYTEAEKLLASVQDSSIADEFKQKIYELAIVKGQWKDAFDLCKNALLPDMTDEGIKNEFASIYALLREELAVQKQGLLKFLIPLGKLQKSLKSAKQVLNPNDALLKYVGQQISGIHTFRFTLAVAVVALGLVTISPWKLIPQAPPPTGSPTWTAIIVIPATKTETMEITETVAPSFTPSETPVLETPIPTVTETFTPIPTPAPIGYGEATIFIFPVDPPNGKRINHSLKPGLVVTLIEQKEDLGGLWYKCRWEENGITYEGWVLAQYIQIVAGP